jgi:hypothetical protein
MHVQPQDLFYTFGKVARNNEFQVIEVEENLATAVSKR